MFGSKMLVAPVMDPTRLKPGLPSKAIGFTYGLVNATKLKSENGLSKSLHLSGSHLFL